MVRERTKVSLKQLPAVWSTNLALSLNFCFAPLFATARLFWSTLLDSLLLILLLRVQMQCYSIGTSELARPNWHWTPSLRAWCSRRSLIESSNRARKTIVWHGSWRYSCRSSSTREARVRLANENLAYDLYSNSSEILIISLCARQQAIYWFLRSSRISLIKKISFFIQNFRIKSS